MQYSYEHSFVSSNVLVHRVRLVRGSLQFQLDGTLEPQAQQLLRVPDQEVDGPVRPGPGYDCGDPDEVVLSLDDDLRKWRPQKS